MIDDTLVLFFLVVGMVLLLALCFLLHYPEFVRIC